MNDWKPMPGMVICEPLEEKRTIGLLELPEGQKSRFARVVAVGPHKVPWKRFLYYPKDVQEGDHILISNVVGIVFDKLLVLPLDQIRCKRKP